MQILTLYTVDRVLKSNISDGSNEATMNDFTYLLKQEMTVTKVNIYAYDYMQFKRHYIIMNYDTLYIII